MFDWNDLRYFLAVAREGSTNAAARVLGVNQSTVQRRLRELERRIGHPLVKRLPTGYLLTDFGRELLPLAAQMEAAVAAVEQQVRGHGHGLSGRLLVTCPEPLVERIARSELLDHFHMAYPGLHVEIVMSDRYLDLRRGEADVALRSGEPDDEMLFGRRIADSTWAVYASRRYIAQHGAPATAADLAHHRLVGLDGPLAGHRAVTWLATVAPGATIVTRNSSVLGLLHSVRSGVALSPLPTTIADAESDLVQVIPPVEELTRGWYLLTTQELRDTPRVRAFFDFVTARPGMIRPILMGDRSGEQVQSPTRK